MDEIKGIGSAWGDTFFVKDSERQPLKICDQCNLGLADGEHQNYRFALQVFEELSEKALVLKVAMERAEEILFDVTREG
jgi:hypothetical protein